jgi:hypothetical protein
MSTTLPSLKAPSKKPFIVREVRADMLRPHPVLSKGAQNLWVRMLGMANGKTGELRHRDHWYDGEDIQKRAQICDRLRKKYIKDLVAAGYVRWTRERIIRIIKGRKRAVLGETRYWVFKSPHEQRVSSTVTSSMVTFRNRSRKSPTILSVNHQEGGGSGVVQVSHHEQRGDFKNHQDDSLFPARLMAKAETILQKQRPHWKPWQVQVAIRMVFRNAYNSRKTPRSAEYFVAGVNNLTEEELNLIESWWNEEGSCNWWTQQLENLRKWKQEAAP